MGRRLEVKLCEVERHDFAGFDADGVDARQVVVVDGALAVREIYQSGRRVVCAPAL